MKPGLTGPGHDPGFTDMNPMTKSECSSAIFTAAEVYSPVARLPFELISASSSNPLPDGNPCKSTKDTRKRKLILADLEVLTSQHRPKGRFLGTH